MGYPRSSPSSTCSACRAGAAGASEAVTSGVDVPLNVQWSGITVREGGEILVVRIDTPTPDYFARTAAGDLVARWVIAWRDDEPAELVYDIKGGPTLAFLAQPNFLESVQQHDRMIVWFHDGEVSLPCWPDDLHDALGNPPTESRFGLRNRERGP